MKSFRIIIADDEPTIRLILKELLIKEGYEVEEAANGEEAILALRNAPFNLAILDYRMPKMDGMEALRQIKKIDPSVTVVMITAHGNTDVAMEAIREGAYDYFPKPFDNKEIVFVVKRVKERQELLKKIERLESQLRHEHKRFDKIVGASSKMQEVFALIRKVATNDVTVLICGESGTGKELVASAIHYQSYRRKKPFIKVSCVAIPETLLESEMFGHEKGSFTGAYQLKPGKFEMAQEGTLFLDEIGDMPLSLQPKLLRVIQERELERVGGTKTIKVDIRLIAATGKDLAECVKNQTFREDLYFRLNVIPIYLPPLRERRDDIPLILEHFIIYYNQKLGKQITSWDQDFMKAVMDYSWPGNVRELENIIQRAIILSSGDKLTVDLLPPNIHTEPAMPDLAAIADDFSVPMPERIQAISDKLEEQMIRHALKKANFRRQETADILGISRKSLHNKMEKYNLFDKDNLVDEKE
ncbi:MAG TPA: sigma-54 dependent transcriptional regulator [Candidatus Sumerlaeota bacterium]|nr:sigma-54 dependent transcriptional regulator [Candidatus Sumerlaeota bacterium]HON50581.1 sigma-54 dependent transcriptional regulator [Candidatus Sumerlaeota bacterium]HPL74841.1 sigma-54 dependent transcriptional regulator [Candidatus Sumerlaeota bacterium]HRS00202.1 sigma-54 dependent transcriptional regulator [Candidatus Sumerlaeia bacterium]